MLDSKRGVYAENGENMKHVKPESRKEKKTTFSPVESKLSTFILITLKGLIFMHIRNVEDNNEKKVIDFFPHNLQ